MRLVPRDHPYSHAKDAVGPDFDGGAITGHLKALLTGITPSCATVWSKGGAQEVYLCEFDGPSERPSHRSGDGRLDCGSACLGIVGDAADHVRAKGLWTNGYNMGVIREALQGDTTNGLEPR